MDSTDRADESFRKSVERNTRKEQGHGLVGKLQEAFCAQELTMQGEYICGPAREDQQDICMVNENPCAYGFQCHRSGIELRP